MGYAVFRVPGGFPRSSCFFLYVSFCLLLTHVLFVVKFSSVQDRRFVGTSVILNNILVFVFCSLAFLCDEFSTTPNPTIVWDRREKTAGRIESEKIG